MKPIKLIMQAFGPFAKTETIVFNKLGDNPLFLINGPTGSGKTSILDAICFALYGETTSNERQGMQMRCDMADTSLPTEVTLEFLLHDKRYRVTRSPEQEAPKSRGEGTTTRKHTAALYDITGEASLVTSKTARVKTEVARIIGLNETQFRQVMVLPQGKFRELLLASSKEREEIFGQLFQTDIYKKIEFALKDKASQISREKNEFDHQIRGALQVAEVACETELTELCDSISKQFEALKKQEQEALVQLNVIKSDVQKAEMLALEFKKREQAKADLNAHEQGVEAIKLLQLQLDNAKQAIKLELPYVNLQSAVKQSETALQSVSSLSVGLKKAQDLEKKHELKLQAAKEQMAQLPLFTQRLFSLETMTGQFAEKAALVKSIADGAEQKDKNKDRLVKYLAFKEQLVAEAKQGQDAFEQARDELATVATIEADIQQKQRLAKDLERLSSWQDEAAKLAAQTFAKQEGVKQAQMNYQNLLRKADTLEMNWHNAQAAVLAKKLQHGETCPVCGSSEHPNPAQFAGEQVTKEQVQYARSQVQTAQTSLNKASSDLEQHNLLMAQYQQQVTQQLSELGDNAKLPLSELHASVSQLSEQLQRLQSINLEQLADSVNKLNQRCVDGENKITELRNQMAADDSTMAAMQAQLIKLNEALDPEIADLVSLEQEITKIKQQIESLNQSFEVAQTELHQSAIAKSQVEKELSTHQKLSQEANDKLSQAKEEWQQVLIASVFKDENHFLQSKISEQEIQALQLEIDAFKQKQTQLEQTLADLNQALTEKAIPDLTVLNEKHCKAQQAYDEVRVQLDNTRSLLERLEKVRNDIVLLHKKNSKLEEEYKVFGTLYDVASGKTGSRISLHRFVLGVLLDDVLIQASQRLSLMSKGRYILERKTQGFKGAAGRGLDLVVEDGYTGKTRDVATLSGGESFMAALALALGLSDVVQSYSGGIRLDTLFIDEGFGSLDPESLDLAIQTLVDLQQSGRMIGIISHVSELKEQISQRIDVSSSRIGSTVSVVN